MKRLRRDRKHLGTSSEPSTLQGHTQRVLQEGRGEIVLGLEMSRVIRDLTSRGQMIKVDRVDRSIEKSAVDPVDLSICYV